MGIRSVVDAVGRGRLRGPVGREADRFAGTGLTVSFDGVVALEDVDLEVRRGEVHGLIGPNGAGKTTLVNVLSGFQRPDRGEVELGRRTITDWPPFRRARAGIQRSFQGVRLFGRMTLLENVEMGAVGVGMSRRRARPLALEQLERVGLVDEADTLASDIAFGSERLVGLARALAGQPDFLMLDEPAAGLNDDETDELTAVIARIRDDMGCGVLVIEHDMQLIMRACDRVSVLDSGRPLASGTPEEIRTNPAVVQAYLGGDADHELA